MRHSLHGVGRTNARSYRDWLESLEARQLLSAIMVTNTLDSGAGSLRAAIAEANSDPGASVIQFDSTVFAVKKSITPVTPLPTISQPLTIEGPGAGLLTINGANKNRLLNVDNGAGTTIAVSISDITLTAGKTTTQGGAIFSLEDLTLTNVVVSKNAAAEQGGGIYSGHGDLTVLNSTLSGNVATGSNAEHGGGGIFMLDGELTIQDSLLSANKAARDGGGGRLPGRWGNTLSADEVCIQRRRG